METKDGVGTYCYATKGTEANVGTVPTRIEGTAGVYCCNNANQCHCQNMLLQQ
jgi:hypothetical protein